MHAFLKACIAKHIAPQLEWDVLVFLPCAAYNFIPNEHSKESPFFLMFGRVPILPLNTLLGPKMRYLGNDINILSLGAIKNMFEIATTNLKMAQKDEIQKMTPNPLNYSLVTLYWYKITLKDLLILSMLVIIV